MSSEPPEPTFASPAPRGSMPAADLDAARLPGGPSTSHPWPAAGPLDGDPGGSPGPCAGRRAHVAVVALAAVAAVVVTGVLGVQAVRGRGWEPLPAPVTEATDAHAVQLVLGTCVAELPDGALVRRVHVVPCEEPHEAQVVGRTDAPAEAVWPGEGAAAARVSRACGPDLLGPAARDGGAAESVAFVVWSPSEDSWARGDRTGLCLAVTPEPATGSLLD
jgi:hypothetical protein